jgi:restriction endonuclease Mrr
MVRFFDTRQMKCSVLAGQEVTNILGTTDKRKHTSKHKKPNKPYTVEEEEKIRKVYQEMRADLAVKLIDIVRRLATELLRSQASVWQKLSQLKLHKSASCQPDQKPAGNP